MCLDNCTSLTYQFANCILDIICDGNVVNSIPMENASITGSDLRGVTIQSCCGQVLTLSPNNLADLGLSLSTLQSFRAQCSAAALASPDYEASNYTILCDSVDSNIYYLNYFTYNDGVAEHHFITMPSGLDSVGMPPVTALPCKDPKIIQKCWRVQNGTSYDYYTELICLVNGVVIGDFYLNHQDNSISTTKPLNAEPCEEVNKTIVCVDKLCVASITNESGTGALSSSFQYIDDFSIYPIGTFSLLTNVLGGIAYTIEHRDFNLANPTLGTIRYMVVETPITQNGATLPQKGVETIGGGTSTFNSFVISFATPISSFGINILDSESTTTFGEAQIILYDAAFNIIHTENLPAGANAVRWYKLQSTLNNISYAVVKVGDEIGGTLSDQIAITNLTFEKINSDPSPRIKKITTLENNQLVIKYYDIQTGQEITDITQFEIIDCNQIVPLTLFQAIRMPICSGGENFLQEVIYANGVLQSQVKYYDLNGDEITTPSSFTLGWCLPVDYEVTQRYVCSNGATLLVKDYYENGLLIATQFINNGIIVAAPSSFTEGACECDKIIAVEQKYLFLNAASNLKVWTLLSKLSNPHPQASTYGSTFTYIGNSVNGTHPSGAYGGGNINGWLVYSMLSATQPANDSNDHYWIEGQPDSFTTFTFNRVNSNLILPNGSSCVPVQEIKREDCSGYMYYSYVTEDGNGNLVDASTLSGWDETKLLGECPKLLEKEICATIDGSTDSYYLDMVYILDPFTADIIPVKYFDKKGNEVTGAIERVCCTCSTLCEIIQNNNPIPNIKCAGYAASFDPNLSQSSFMQGFGRYSQPFWDGSCGAGTVTGFTWELDSFIHNGVEQLTSPMIVTVPFSSMTLTASGVPTNYANAFNVLLNTKGINLDPDMAVKSYVNGDTFVIAFRQYANPIACSAPPSSRLEIVTESGDGWEYMPTSNPTLAQIQAFTAAGNFTSLATNSACQAI